MVIIKHHTRYKEIHGNDETESMEMSDHVKFHRELRKSGMNMIPANVLSKISQAASQRSKETKERINLYRFTFSPLHVLLIPKVLFSCRGYSSLQRNFRKNLTDADFWKCRGKIKTVQVDTLFPDFYHVFSYRYPAVLHHRIDRGCVLHARKGVCKEYQSRLKAFLLRYQYSVLYRYHALTQSFPVLRARVSPMPVLRNRGRLKKTNP